MSITAPERQAGFRDAMAHLCAPVGVITAMDDDRPHGTTVSALMSLSVRPPLVAVSLAQTSDCLALIRRTGIFGVNVLGAGQDALAIRFAAKGPEKFAAVHWQQRTGVPFIDGSAVWLGCQVAGTVTGGDHEILLGEVVDLQIDPDASPLTYHDRRFGTHTAHEGDR
ncbi:MAG: flavin reductase family protein [Gordonia sp. (in: high G+C Gram-positive bacteria)]